MRQKDVDEVLAVARKEVDFADTCELPGIAALVGAFAKHVKYGNYLLDVTALEALAEECHTPRKDHVSG